MFWLSMFGLACAALFGLIAIVEIIEFISKHVVIV